MAVSAMRKILTMSFALIAALVTGLAPALAEVVGRTTAYQTNITRNGGGALAVGSPINLGDRLQSNATGLGMIVFNDESSAKIGPNSRLTIDEFVYSPGSRQGQVSVGMQQGLTRFYGGQLSKGGNMEVRTPHMVLGARGGIITVFVVNGLTIAILVSGSMTCVVDGVTQIVTNPGYACTSEDGVLSVGYGGLDPFPILDSLSETAGTGVPGSTGGGIDATAFCASPIGNQVSACQSTDGSLPGFIFEFDDPPSGGGPAGSGDEEPSYSPPSGTT
ncbi:MAG: FecR domain-containing protein [Pseudomonadota bacterium]